MKAKNMPLVFVVARLLLPQIYINEWMSVMIMRISYFRKSVICLTIVAGCTSCASLSSYFGSEETYDDESKAEFSVEQTAELTVDELDKYNQEWEDIKIKVDRLVKIEDDLALIMQEVGKSSKLKNVPPEYLLTDYIEAEYDGENQKGEKSPGENMGAGSKRQYYAAHLGLFLRKDNARMGWEVLHQRYPKIFNELTPLVKEIKRSDQVIYSLRVGPFDDLETSKLMCSVFVQYKYKCEPTDFNGDAIGL